jgi:hypothetical protein
MNILSVKNSDIQVLQQDIKEHIVETNFMINLMFIINQRWIQHDLVGGWVLFQFWCQVVSVMCAAHPSTCITTIKSCLTTVFEL